MSSFGGENDLDGTPYGRELKEKYFLLGKGNCNLNHGSYGTLPRPVLQRQQQFVEEQESHPDKWFRENCFVYIDQARKAIADYMKSSLSDIVLVENASAAVNAVLRSIGLQKGSKVLTLSTAYGMVRETLEWLVQTVDIEVVIVDIIFPLHSSSQVIQAVSSTLESVDGVALCIFSHITSMPAAILPVADLCTICRGAGAMVMIDGAHAPGQIDVNIPSIGADFYLGNCHKWLFAPKGSAFLWTSPAQQTDISPAPTVISGSGERSYMGRFSYTGTRDYTPFTALPAALRFREALGGEERLTSYCRGLAATGGRRLAEAWGTSLLVSEELTAFMVNIILPSEDAEAIDYIRKALDRVHSIFIVVDRIPAIRSRTGNDIYFTRLSSQVYLELSDFTQLAELVPELLAEYLVREKK